MCVSMICMRVHISTYLQTQTLIFILCKSRELYNGGEGLVYTDLCHVSAAVLIQN